MFSSFIEELESSDRELKEMSELLKENWKDKKYQDFEQVLFSLNAGMGSLSNLRIENNEISQHKIRVNDALESLEEDLRRAVSCLNQD